MLLLLVVVVVVNSIILLDIVVSVLCIFRSIHVTQNDLWRLNLNRNMVVIHFSNTTLKWIAHTWIFDMFEKKISKLFIFQIFSRVETFQLCIIKYFGPNCTIKKMTINLTR